MGFLCGGDEQRAGGAAKLLQVQEGHVSGHVYLIFRFRLQTMAKGKNLNPADTFRESANISLVVCVTHGVTRQAKLNGRRR